MNRFKSSVLATVSAGAILCVASASWAQTADDTTTVDDIIVTATKQASNVQDVPVTVNVVQGEQLEEQVILKFEDVATLTPGLSLTNRDGRQQQASVRGVAADLDAGSTSTVDIYFNETVLDAATAFQSIYDIGQIEVVRGPQGTLRGRASPSGAILITTRRPSFSGLDGFVSATATDNGVQNYQAAIGAPVSDTLAFRLAALYDEGDDTGVRGLTNGREAGHETWSARGSVAWRPTDALDVDLVYQKMESDTDAYFAVYGNGAYGDYDIFDRVNFQDGPTTFYNASDIATLTSSYDLGSDFSLNYIGGFQDTQFDTLRDLDIGNAIPFFQYNQDIRIGNQNWSHELRFQRSGPHFWTYMVGAYYSTSDTDVLVDIPIAALVQTSDIQGRNFGIFTNHAFQLTENDLVQVGLRYSETKSESETNSSLAGISNAESQYDAVTGSASYQHDFSEDLMGYVSYGRGYRPGGRAEDATAPYLPEELKLYDAEESDSIEVGLKSQLFDRRLTLNATVYNQTFKNFIGRLNGIACTGAPGTSAPGGLGYATADGTANGIDCNANFTFNGDGISRGVELEARGRITDYWTATFNAAYTDAHFDDAEIPCNDFNGDGTPDIDGPKRVQGGKYVSTCRSSGSLGALPEWSFSIASEYTQPIGRFEGFVRGLVNYSGDVTTLNTGYTADAYTLANLFIGFRDPDAGWEVTAFAKNLFDHQQQLTEEGSASLFGVPSPYRFGTVSQPREIGVTLRYAFGR
ncbi:hypothetical protein ASG17_12675 [Brevundimonas sp. Leaf363]|uniref:TonB-dependent receptor n=1 Tax=Brevundimonas sp. Leaf363 TaxID=1736353 RepID=UPI0006F7C2DA|nr:TonB-dependent receptor [Brevundimonas sp. Leaf363]KQS53815.1 hypothetical protein ASG17_12675 [Brevundimonas sp. Leaf363]